jgi:hypothetical protein
MFSLTVTVPNIKVNPQLLTKEIMRGCGVIVVNNYRQRINKGEGVKGGNIIALKPLSEITKRRKGSDIPLIDTAAMANSFRVDDGQSTENKVIMNFPPEQAWKAGIHQKGIKIKPKKEGGILAIPMGGEEYIFCKSVTIPVRPHVGFSDKDIEDATGYLRLATLKEAEKGIVTE